jgi:hypothetical protein
VDKTLITSLVVLLAALAPLAGLDVAPEEQQALTEGVAQVVAGGASLALVARAIILRRRAKAEPPAPAPEEPQS